MLDMKKSVVFMFAGILVVVAIVLLAIFASGGENDTGEVKLPDLTGIWRIVVYTNEKDVSIVEQEYMVFKDGVASDYRDGNEDPYASSEYEVEQNKLLLPDLSKEYRIEQRTDNYIQLYESQGVYMDLIRYPNEDMSELKVDSGALVGKWEIKYRRSQQPYAGDSLLFDENGMVSQFKAGADEAVSTSEYTQETGHLLVNGWGKEMVIYPLNNDTVILVELYTDMGFIWELQKES